MSLAVVAVTLAVVGRPHHVRHHHRVLHHHRRQARHHHVAAVVPHHFADAAHPVQYREFVYGHARYYMVVADLHSPRVEMGTVLSHGLSTVSGLVRRRKSACAAITGTFFCPSSGQPVGDVLVDGKIKARGYRGSAVAVDWAGRPHIFDTRFGKRVNWSGYQWALRGAVRLVREGHATPNPKAQHFHDPRIWSHAERTGVGVTGSGKLVLVATRNEVTLHEFARAMIHRGVRNAVNLDGGSSTCLYYRGSVLIHPARRLSNMFVISEFRPNENRDATAWAASRFSVLTTPKLKN